MCHGKYPIGKWRELPKAPGSSVVWARRDASILAPLLLPLRPPLISSHVGNVSNIRWGGAPVIFVIGMVQKKGVY